MRTYRAPQKSVLFLFLSTRQKGWKRLKSMRLSRGVRSPLGFSCLARARVTFSKMVIFSVGIGFWERQESDKLGDWDMVRAAAERDHLALGEGVPLKMLGH